MADRSAQQLDYVGAIAVILGVCNVYEVCVPHEGWQHSYMCLT